MKMKEIVDQINFILGLPANENVEELDTRQAVNIAFRELKRYMRTSVEKTVPFSHRLDLEKLEIHTTKILNVFPAEPRPGLTMQSFESGNVFQIAAAWNVNSAIGNTTTINIDPLMSELGMAQVRNTLSTDFQWKYDALNEVIYLTHRDPLPTFVTVRYVPDFQDVSEIVDTTWIDYLIRLATANMKLALGRTRSKYRVEGSNVSLDGEVLLAEANQELDKIREELGQKRKKLVIVN